MGAMLLLMIGSLYSTGSARGGELLEELLAAPLACSFQAVSIGQFRELDYAPGVPSGTTVVMIAASPEDLHQGKAALIERERAAIAQIVLTSKLALFVGAVQQGDIVALTLFVSARSRSGLPASLTRQSMVGNVPILAQSTGLCHPGINISR
ncbi:hypothetical protein ABIE45_006322 [Methylobacterium sp. OAE515]|uniref:hypothetical protein n=1 Tax=Methylobacterium sp. OAE515 TaxID=2817895 RepID=UPI00178C1683